MGFIKNTLRLGQIFVILQKKVQHKKVLFKEHFGLNLTWWTSCKCRKKIQMILRYIFVSDANS